MLLCLMFLVVIFIVAIVLLLCLVFMICIVVHYCSVVLFGICVCDLYFCTLLFCSFVWCLLLWFFYCFKPLFFCNIKSRTSDSIHIRCWTCLSIVKKTRHFFVLVVITQNDWKKNLMEWIVMLLSTQKCRPYSSAMPRLFISLLVHASTTRIYLTGSREPLWKPFFFMC